MDSTAGFGRYSLDLSLTLDGGKFVGLQGATAFVHLKNHIEEFGSTFDKETEIYSNMDAASRTTLYELWLQQKATSWLQIKGGKIDASTEFAAVPTAADFLNSSMGYSPTIMAFPSYPEPKPGIAASLQFSEKYRLKLGAFATTCSGLLAIVEPAMGWTHGIHGLPGNVGLGYWRLDSTLPRFAGGASSLTQGYYAVVEQSLWRQRLQGENNRMLSGFLQVGHGDSHVSPITHHLGAGLVLRAPFASRPEDGLGVAATWIHFSDDPAAGFDRNTEWVPESYYKISLNKNFALLEDFQYLHHPGGARTYPECPVLTSRFSVSF